MKRSLDRTGWSVGAVVVVAALLSTACTAGPGVASATPTSTPRSSATAGPSMAPPSAAGSTSPSPTAAPLIWTKASLKKDWPAPTRSEPAGPPTIVPVYSKTVYTDCPGANCETEHEGDPYVDPTGDTGSGVLPWVDITRVDLGDSGLCISLASAPGCEASAGRPGVGPTEQWMAYGIVFDTDRDGVADRRYGVDNMPLDGPVPSHGDWPHRAWITDLHSGRTESAAGPPYGEVGKTFFDTWWSPLRWSIGGEAAGGGTMGKTFDVPFYLWASEIKDGRVVATDYAPDVGWIVSSTKKP